MAPPPALTTVRGFHGTPVTSGDEDSDYGGMASSTGSLGRGRGSTPGGRGRKQRLPLLDDVVSAHCSPVLRPTGSPAMSGIAKLRMQLDPLSLDTSSAASSRASSPAKAKPITTTTTTLLSRGSGHSSRSTSQDRVFDRVSSNTSGDETGPDAGAPPAGRRARETTSYVINLENDFVSEGVRWTAEDSTEQGIFDTTDLLGEEVVAATATVADNDKDISATVDKKMTADDFAALRCLGKGSYGTVLLVKQKTTGRLYAQKQFKKASLVVHKKLIEQTKTERQILESVSRHPFVVKLYYAFQDREKLYLILEYGQGGELFTHLSAERMFSEPTAAFYMAEMALALAHLHDTLGVVYRDLKPENCLLDAEGHLLLTDFGLSKVALPGEGAAPGEAEEACCHSMLGTVEYMAPEVVQGHKYGRAVDWWSFGALGYDLLTGNPPFRGRNKAKIQDNIVRQKLVLPYFLTPDAKDLLTRLLQKNPRKRLGANMPKDLATMQGHRFFRKIDWKRLAARELEPPIQPVITDPELAENFAPEFTDLPLSPVLAPAGPAGPSSVGAGASATSGRGSFKDDPFGGFSFVASTSLLNESHFPLMA